MEKTWRCTVCGYLHKGDRPPDICPVCKVDASKFELLGESENSAAPVVEVPALGLLAEMRASFVPHAVSAHFPNALLPTTVLFLLLFLLTRDGSFETTMFYLLLVAVLAVPPTFATGLFDWKQHYAGTLAPIFRKKIILGILLFCLGLTAALWRWQNPEVLNAGGFSACAFSILIFAMLGCVTLLGHFGGMLVFAKHAAVQSSKQEKTQ